MTSWSSFLRAEAKEEYFQAIIAKVQEDAKTVAIYPKREDIFNAFRLCPYDQVKVILLGQDPYHGEGQAHGLCFSVPAGIAIPPSLRNIYQELENDIGIKPAKSGDLTPWAKQGVLLLNSSLTVKAGEAGSHSEIGWRTLTDKVISQVNEMDRPVVYLLWGKHAQSKMRLIDNPKHLILTSAHPSPLSAHNGFFGSKHFSQCNAFLVANGQVLIDWRIE